MRRDLFGGLLLAGQALADYSVGVLDANKGFDAATDQITVQWVWKAGDPEPDRLILGDFLLCTTIDGVGFKCDYLEQQVDIRGKASHTMNFTKALALAGDGKYTVQLTGKDKEYQPEMQVVDYYMGFFSVKGMTGTGAAIEGGIPDSFVQGVQPTVSWSTYSLPLSLSSLRLDTTAGYLMPYTWQKGPTRTAPFQSTPGTKVTAKGVPTRRYPTSSWTPFKSNIQYKYMPVTTVTPSPVSTQFQTINWQPTLETTPSGYRPSKVLPQLASVSSVSSHHRKRWIDR